jgi:hypothetical protein
MTDIEINKALALAIGWPEHLIDAGRYYSTDKVALCLRPKVYPNVDVWKFFDYRDWNVIGPIAERYDCFPLRLRGRAWEAISRGKYKLGFFNADTPQRAIALAVIGATK